MAVNQLVTGESGSERCIERATHAEAFMLDLCAEITSIGVQNGGMIEGTFIHKSSPSC